MFANNKILLIFAHPAFHKSRVNKELINSVKSIKGVTFKNLYEEYPDYHIQYKKEQQLLLEHDIIIWHHPFYWYSCPPLLKEWIDLVLQHNFAYGKKGTALSGKSVMSVITTGGQQQAYQTNGFNRFTIRQFLAPFEQTVKLCRMDYLPPFVVHGSHLMSDDVLGNYKADYRLIVSNLIRGIENNLVMQHEYFNSYINQ